MSDHADKHGIVETGLSNTDIQLSEGTCTWKPQKQDYIILACLSFISLIVALDSTILVTALPSISDNLNGTANEAFWSATSYLLTYAVFQPAIAAISETFGRRWPLFSSVLLFAMGSLIACLARNFACLLAGRTVQGIGGGGVMVLVLVVATDIIPPRYLPRFQSIIQVSWALGTIGGPVIGGVFAQLTTWRWIFYINFPMCGIGLVAIPFSLKRLDKESPSNETTVETDWLGIILLTGAITSFLVSITLGGTEYPWNSFHFIVPLIIGIMGMAGTIVWETLGAKRAIVRPSLFRRPAHVVPYLCAAIQGLLLLATFYYFSLYLEAVKRLSPIMIGVALLACSGGMIPVSAITGMLITKSGHIRWFIVAGWLVTCLGTGLLSLCDAGTPAVEWVWLLVVCGVGHGILIVSHIYAAQSNSSTRDLTNATAFCCFTRSIGLCMGVAIGGTIFQNMLARYLEDKHLAGAIATTAETYAVTLKSLPADDENTVVIAQAFSQSFQTLAQILAGIGAVGWVLSFAVPEHVLENGHIRQWG